jgi:hypothetical protein
VPSVLTVFFLFSFYFIIFTFTYMHIHCLCHLPLLPLPPNPTTRAEPVLLSFLWLCFFFFFFRYNMPLITSFAAFYRYLRSYLLFHYYLVPGIFFLSFLFFFILFIHMCIQCLGHFFPLPLASSLTPPTPRYPAETILPLYLILLKTEYKQ